MTSWILKSTLSVFTAACLAGGLPALAQTLTPAEVDFRGFWIATASAIDWPSTTANITTQRQEIVSTLNTCQAIGMNAVILQVRPECDAFYPSTIEPWSRWLTGTQGTAPGRAWDPLQFTIDECRRRGLELHAWFNPYRAATNRTNSFSTQHVTTTHPEFVESFSSDSTHNYYWLNPGHPGTIPYTSSVIMDVVNRYDIDGVHMDDYFYPSGINATTNPFPDSTEFAAYGGGLTLANWRRSNTNSMVAQIKSSIQNSGKPNVRFGISPSGIWRSGYPSGTSGQSAYDELFADTKKWLVDGTLDYIAPQIYWGMAEDGYPAAQDFDSILNWWTNASQNPLGRQIYSGLAAYRIVDGSNWPPQHVVNEVNYQRNSSSSNGSIFFSTKHLTMNAGKGAGDATDGYLSDMLKAQQYTKQATTPAYTNLDNIAPAQPSVAWSGTSGALGNTAYWTPQGVEYPQWYVVYWSDGTTWSHKVVPDWQRSFTIATASVRFAVQALDRVGNRSTMTPTDFSGVSPAIPTQPVTYNVRNFDTDTLAFLTGSGSNTGVTPGTSADSTEESNNRLDPRLGTPGAESRKVPFTWTGASGGRYRLTTSGTNPYLDLTKGLGVYVKLLSGKLDIRLAIRETGGTGPIGANNASIGLTEPIEMTSPAQIIASPNWQYIHFDIPNETYTSFNAGNGQLNGTWGVLESLMIYQVQGAGTNYTLYIDDIHQGASHTPIGEPPTPRGLVLNRAGSGHINLSWAASQALDFKKYRIYRSLSPDVQAIPANFVAEVTNPSYSDNGTARDTVYYYKVNAVDQFGYESGVVYEPSINSLPLRLSHFSME